MEIAFYGTSAEVRRRRVRLAVELGSHWRCCQVSMFAGCILRSKHSIEDVSIRGCMYNEWRLMDVGDSHWAIWLVATVIFLENSAKKIWPSVQPTITSYAHRPPKKKVDVGNAMWSARET